MAHNNTTFITNLDAAKQVFADVHKHRGRVRAHTEVITFVAGDAAGDTWTLFRMDSNDVMLGIFVWADAALAGATDINIGLREPNPGGTSSALTPNADDCLVDGDDWAAGALVGGQIFGTGGTEIAGNYGQGLWKHADPTDTANPYAQGTKLDVFLTAVSEITTGGDVALTFLYLAGD